MGLGLGQEIPLYIQRFPGGLVELAFSNGSRYQTARVGLGLEYVVVVFLEILFCSATFQSSVNWHV